MTVKLGAEHTAQLKTDFSSVVQDLRGPITSEQVERIKTQVLDRYAANGELTPDVRATLEAMAELVGLTVAQAQSGLDQATILRNISNLPAQVALRDARPVGEVTEQHGLNTLRFDELIASSTKAVDALLAKRGGEGYGTAVTGQISVNQIGGEYAELKKFAWEQHYNPAKAAIFAGDLELAMAHLEVVGACLGKMSVLAQGNVAEEKVVDNRMGMMLHQRSLIAHAARDQEGIGRFEMAALRFYAQALTKEDKNDPPYNPAIHYNAACSLNHLGKSEPAVGELVKMLDACKDDAQRDRMKRDVYDVDVELKNSGLWDQAYQRYSNS